MKITFILPGIGKKTGQRYIKTWTMEPLTIAVLKALTPPDVETEFFDDRIELIDYETKTDLVAITVETYTASRAYQIARKFRERGVKVVLGGYHVTLLPVEAAAHADAIVVGNAESVWNKVLDDLRVDKLKERYDGSTLYVDRLPDRSIFRGKRYLPLTLLETGRGCPFSCAFCAIASYYKSCYCPKSIAGIVSEAERAQHRYAFFVDDNIAANPNFAAKLFDEITPLKIRWTSQASLTIARDRNLLEKMRRSGCEALLIGFESLDERNLNQMRKDWRYQLGEVDELVKTIHGEGINIYATFVFGFDYDTLDSFRKALDFSLEHKFLLAAFNHLLPFPGTPLYDRLKAQKRLLLESWWLEPDYHYGEIAFQPQNMSPEELTENCAALRRAFYRFSSIFQRGGALLKRNPDPLLSLIYWSQNIKLGQEVDEKLNIPVGRGLDALPK